MNYARLSFYVNADPWLGKDTYVANRNARSSSATTFGGDPVNVVFGNYTYQHTDLSVPSIGLPFTFQRSYNSANAATNGALGYGWTHNFAMTAVPQTYGATNLVVVTLEDGRQDAYSDNGNGTFTPPAGTFDTLTQNAGLYTLTRKDQTRYNFNTSGKLASIVDKNGNTMTLTYSGNDLTQIADTAGRTYTLTYSPNHQITQLTDPLSRTVSFTYDASGNLATHTDPRAKTTTYAYDASHRLTSITDANGHTFVQNVYDADGRVAQQRDAKLNLTAFAYYTMTLRTIITDTRGYATTYDYDTQYRVTSERDALSQTLSYVFDASNNRTQVTDKRGSITRYGYDSLGNTTFITDALSSVYRFTYDSHSNLLTKTDPLSRVTTNTYDAHDNLLTTTNISGTTTFAYNARGLLTSVTDARGNTTQYGYNANGDRTSATDPLGNVTSATFDNGGRRLTQTDPLGHATTFAYNANNNLTTITDALAHTTTYTYDNVGNRTALTDANANTTTFAYDEKDQLVTVTDARGGSVTYAYDAAGNKTRMTDANSHATNYTYDALGRLLTVTDSLAHTTTYAYDANGNKTSIVDAKAQTTTFTYDALNRLTKIQYPTSNVQYTYDAVGNRLTMADPTGTTTYTYDGFDRLTRVQSPISNLQYSYDAVGNRTRIVYPSGSAVTYTYDAANRLTNVTDWASRAFAYIYDAASNRTRLNYPNGAYTTYTYDALNRHTALTTTGASGTLFTASYALDNVGNRMQMVDSEGTTNYSYDTLYRLSNFQSPTSNVQYTYDAMGNRATMTTTGSGTTNYSYDVADRLLAAGATAFTWDNNGNQLTKGAAIYAYDAANRLTQVVNGGTTVQFTYDGDGKRANKTVNSAATNYAYDVNASLPVVLTETTSSNTTTYLFGADLLARYDNAGTPTYYHADGLGSVRAMSNSAGQSIATYNYDAFGAVRNSSGAASTFKFVGEQADDEAGLIYLRARYYDPATGRFLSPDKWRGAASSDQSLNRYIYAQNSSTRLVDISGNKPSDVDLLQFFGKLHTASEFYGAAKKGIDLYKFAADSVPDEVYSAYRSFKHDAGREPTKAELDEYMSFGFGIEYKHVFILEKTADAVWLVGGNPIVEFFFPRPHTTNKGNDKDFAKWYTTVYNPSTSGTSGGVELQFSPSVRGTSVGPPSGGK